MNCNQEDIRKTLVDHLSTIFPHDDVSSAEFVRIGGMSNKNYKVTLNGSVYVLRVPGNGSDGMVDRSNEDFNAQQGCKLGINPMIRYFDSSTGLKLVDFILNAQTMDPQSIQQPDTMKDVAEIYRKLHGSGIVLKNEFNIFREIEKYDVLMERAGAQMYDGWEEVRARVMSLEEHLATLGTELCACHNDAVPENFIQAEDGTLYLIDWEYLGNNDPMADFAALFLESNFTKENQDTVLNHYFWGDIPEHAREKIICYQILWDYLWAQWTVIKEACGDDFGTYGTDRYNRAIVNLLVIGK